LAPISRAQEQIPAPTLVPAAGQPAAVPPVEAAVQPEMTQAVPASAAAAEPTPIVRQPIVHTLSFPAPATHVLEVQSLIPADGRETIELMMSMWTPGYYRIENYANEVQNFSAQLPTGEPLTFDKPAGNRWRINTQGEPTVLVSYRLVCERGSVSRNYVGESYAVICGGPTYTTLVREIDRPHEVRLNLPAQWGDSATGLDPSPTGFAHHYFAKDFDTLMDSPIAVGELSTHSFEVAGVRHYLVDMGEPQALANWNGEQVAAELAKMVQETRNFWGFLPFDRYFFLNKLSRGGGGLEHLNSTLIHTAPQRLTPRSRLRWLNFVAHEYFHAFNVKRLRPIELGPFDYERARRTSGLWVAEGLTNYFNSLIVARSGLATSEQYLGTMSGHIRQLQRAPGRLKQSLAASSLETWTGEGFGPRASDSTISYYVKGPVVGFLLDARIRRATNGVRSLDDAIRLAYERYSGERGYTEEEFLQVCQEVAGMDLTEFFAKALFSTEELDYSEALDWFGLCFAPPEDGEPTWRLEVTSDATDAQRRHFADLVAPSMAPSLIAAAAAAAEAQQAAQQPAAQQPAAQPAATQPPVEQPSTAPPPAPAQQPLQPQPPTAASAQPVVNLIDGIGGVFIYSNDVDRLAEWYRKHLGIDGEKYADDGAFVFAFKYRRAADPRAEDETVWAILPTAEPRTPTPPQYQINYRVKDMAAMLAHLRSGGVEIEKEENYSYGRFAWVRDPDGNRVELFQKLSQ
jgi:predicted metalloprotease with PDZ domain/catechol 2,3-dioxygenase-like lactoylglutathione lyase family enzyme